MEGIKWTILGDGRKAKEYSRENLEAVLDKLEKETIEEVVFKPSCKVDGCSYARFHWDVDKEYHVQACVDEGRQANLYINRHVNRAGLVAMLEKWLEGTRPDIAGWDFRGIVTAADRDGFKELARLLTDDTDIQKELDETIDNPEEFLYKTLEDACWQRVISTLRDNDIAQDIYEGDSLECLLDRIGYLDNAPEINAGEITGDNVAEWFSSINRQLANERLIGIPQNNGYYAFLLVSDEKLEDFKRLAKRLSLAIDWHD